MDKENKTICDMLLISDNLNNEEQIIKVASLMWNNNGESIELILKKKCAEELKKLANASEGEIGNIEMRRSQGKIEAYQELFEELKNYSIQAKEFLKNKEV